MVCDVQRSSHKRLEACPNRLEERMIELQATTETKIKALHAELGFGLEQQLTENMQTALEDRCRILEARQTAQIEQFKCSEEVSGSTVDGLVKRVSSLEDTVEKRYAALDARIGSGCVSEQVNGVADRIHRRMSTVQALMERRCSTMESQVCALHKDISGGRDLQEEHETALGG